MLEALVWVVTCYLVGGLVWVLAHAAAFVFGPDDDYRDYALVVRLCQWWLWPLAVIAYLIVAIGRIFGR